MDIIFNFPKRAAVLLITLYQKTLSPDHGFFRARFPYGYCRHYPTCSQYTKEAIGRFGLLKGAGLGLNRILRCNPWAEPKIDTVPVR